MRSASLGVVVVMLSSTAGLPAGESEMGDQMAGPLGTAVPASRGEPVGEPFLLGLAPQNPPCPSDVTGDSFVDVNDLLMVITQWGACTGACDADLTGDGVIDVQDLVDVMVGWGVCADDGCVPTGQLINTSTGQVWNPAAGYQLDCGASLALVLDCAEPYDVVFQVWRDGVFAPYTDGQAGFAYPGTMLTHVNVPPGSGEVQALLRRQNEPPFAALVFPTTFMSPPTTSPQCSDGADNDGDGLIDYPADPGCSNASDNTEATSGPVEGPVCGNGICEGPETATSCPGDCGTGNTGDIPAVECFYEDWELGNYSRWGMSYFQWSGCASNGFAQDKWVSPTRSHRSQVNCTGSDSHRGYGLLRFSGDDTVPFSVNSSGGINSQHGVVITFWSWLDVPYSFGNGRWLSLMTVTDNCSNAWVGVLTLNIDDATMRLKPVHVNNVTYEPNAPSFPLRQWVRTTVYLNYYSEQMHVWQNGTKVASATFSRPGLTACQWHFGLYASAQNNNIVLYEEDITIHKLTAPLPNLVQEPLVQE